MHIGILFYSDTIILAHGNPQGILGRAVANHDFLWGLSQYGEFRVTLFVSSQVEKEYLVNFLKEQNYTQPPAVVCFQEMMAFCQRQPIQVLHVMDVNLHRGVAIRDQLPQPQPVVTGVTHSLGHKPFLDWMALNLVHEARDTDALICTTPTAKKVIEKMFQVLAPRFKNPKLPALKVIPLAVQTGTLCQPGDHLRKELNCSEDATVFMYFGRLSHRLKTDLVPLIQAFAEARSKAKKPLYLIMAGATGQENYLEHLQRAAQELGVGRHIGFVPNPDQEQKAKLFRTADVFVAMSDNTQETFGLSVIEAFSAGLPVIAAEWNGYRSLVQHQKNGLLIPTMALSECELLDQTASIQLDSVNQMFLSQAVAIDSQKLTAAMILLADDQALQNELGKGAQETAVHYDWKPVIAQYQDLWANLVEKASQNEWPEYQDKTLNYHKVFSHYPTQLLQNEHKLEITKRGQKALSGHLNLQVYPGMEEVIQVNALAHVLNQAQNHKTVSIALELGKKDFSRDLLKYHVMWAYKHGLIAVKN